MDRNDVSWQGYWPACPTPFAGDGSSTSAPTATCSSTTSASASTACSSTAPPASGSRRPPPERRRVAETAIDAVAGRVPVVVGCAAYTAREAAEYGRHALAAGAAGIECDAAALLQDLRRRDGRLLRGPGSGDRRARCSSTTGRTARPSTSAPISPTGSSTSTTWWRSRTGPPTRSSSTRPPARVVGRVRVFGPFMSREGFERLLADGGDGFIGGGTIFGAADTGFWEDYWRGDYDALPGPRRARRPTVPEALAARRLGRRATPPTRAS